MRILVVEDEPDANRFLARGLREQSFAVDSAFDGATAIEKAHVSAYDLVLLDLMLPDMNGLDVCTALRKAGITAPVLMLTARGEEADRIRGLSTGADDYVAKPFQTEELIARLRALIRRASGNASSELTAGDVRLDTRSGKVTKAA